MRSRKLFEFIDACGKYPEGAKLLRRVSADSCYPSWVESIKDIKALSELVILCTLFNDFGLHHNDESNWKAAHAMAVNVMAHAIVNGRSNAL